MLIVDDEYFCLIRNGCRVVGCLRRMQWVSRNGERRVQIICPNRVSAQPNRMPAIASKLFANNFVSGSRLPTADPLGWV